MIKDVALAVSIILFLMVVFGSLRTILQPRRLFVLPLNETTYRAFTLLTILAAGLFAYARLDLHITSLEIAGVKADVGQLRQRVDTLSAEMEEFFGRKKIESFDRHNWNERVSTVMKKPDGTFILQVTLDQEPIVNSV